MLTFGDIVIKFERGFVQCFGCGPIVFRSTIICIDSIMEIIFSEKTSSTVFELLYYLLILKQNPKGYLTEDTKINHVVKWVQIS